ncbi:hypothetical protein ABKN59_006203 [Abortiporus biennis]
MIWEDCNNLQRLEISSIYDLEPNALPPCFPSHPIYLSNLRELKIDFVQSHAARMISCLHAPLQSLTLSFDVFEDTRENIPTLLQHFASTLEDVHLSFAEFSHEPPYLPIYFPQVHSLELEYSDIPNMEWIIYTFPNITSFRLYNEDGFYDVGHSRAQNIDRACRLEASHHGWEKLEVVSGDLLSLFGAGLSYKVSLMDIGWVDHPEVTNLCKTVFNDMQPRTLQLIFEEPALKNNLTEDTKKMLNYPRLNTLVSRFYSPKDISEIQIQDFIDILIELLRQTQHLKHFSFYIRCHFLLLRGDVTLPEPNILDSIISDSLVDRLLEAIPSLESIRLGFEDVDPSDPLLLDHNRTLLDTQLVWKAVSTRDMP